MDGHLADAIESGLAVENIHLKLELAVLRSQLTISRMYVKRLSIIIWIQTFALIGVILTVSAS